MTATIANTLMTSEEMFALPRKKGVRYELYRGELIEDKAIVSKRNANHCLAVANVTRILGNWAIQEPTRRGTVYTSDIYFRICASPETNVGIDVALASPMQHQQVSMSTKYIEGPPLLAIEVLSPSDRISKINLKLEAYLDNGTSLVWILDPFQKTVSIHRKAQAPVLLNMLQDLICEPEMPSFKCAVAELYA